MGVIGPQLSGDVPVFDLDDRRSGACVCVVLVAWLSWRVLTQCVPRHYSCRLRCWHHNITPATTCDHDNDMVIVIKEPARETLYGRNFVPQCHHTTAASC